MAGERTLTVSKRFNLESGFALTREPRLTGGLRWRRATIPVPSTCGSIVVLLAFAAETVVFVAALARVAVFFVVGFLGAALRVTFFAVDWVVVNGAVLTTAFRTVALGDRFAVVGVVTVVLGGAAFFAAVLRVFERLEETVAGAVLVAARFAGVLASAVRVRLVVLVTVRFFGVVVSVVRFRFVADDAATLRVVVFLAAATGLAVLDVVFAVCAGVDLATTVRGFDVLVLLALAATERLFVRFADVFD